MAISMGPNGASLVSQWLKRKPTPTARTPHPHHLPMYETQVRSLGQEDPLEKEMATHSSILA